MTNKVKKLFYKKWWFCVIAALLVGGLAGCGEGKVKKEESASSSSSVEQSVKKSETSESKEKQSEKTSKEEWHKNYDGTKFNQKTIQIKNADTYSSSKSLGNVLEDVDSATYSLQHISISTNFIGINGEKFKAPKGKSYIIAAWKIKNNNNVDFAGGIVPNITVLPNDNSFLKEETFERNEDVNKYINTKEQTKFIEGEEDSFPRNSVKNLNAAYEIPNDFVRYISLEDETGKMDHYSDLSHMIFSLGMLDKKGKNNGINIGNAMQQEK